MLCVCVLIDLCIMTAWQNLGTRQMFRQQHRGRTGAEHSSTIKQLHGCTLLGAMLTTSWLCWPHTAMTSEALCTTTSDL